MPTIVSVPVVVKAVTIGPGNTVVPTTMDVCVAVWIPRNEEQKGVALLSLRAERIRLTPEQTFTRRSTKGLAEANVAKTRCFQSLMVAR